MPRRPPPKPTEARLRHAAAAHLERWGSTRANLRRLLRRRVAKGLAEHGGEAEPLHEAIEHILDDLERLGLLNDEAFARSRLRSLIARGTSPGVATGRLLAKGVPMPLAREMLGEQQEQGVSPMLLAACNLARRRRLGPWRPAELRAEHRADDLTKLGRAGFPYSVALEVVDTDDADALEQRALGREAG